MSEVNATRTFQCKHCASGIQVPANLPPTTAPCPKCGQPVTSPAFESPPVEVPEQPIAEVSAVAETPPAAPPATEKNEAVETPSQGKAKMIVIAAVIGAVLLMAAAAVKGSSFF